MSDPATRRPTRPRAALVAAVVPPLIAGTLLASPESVLASPLDDVSPSSEGLPGAGLFTQILSWGFWLALGVCGLAILYGAANTAGSQSSTTVNSDGGDGRASSFGAGVGPSAMMTSSMRQSSRSHTRSMRWVRQIASTWPCSVSPVTSIDHTATVAAASAASMVSTWRGDSIQMRSAKSGPSSSINVK